MPTEDDAGTKHVTYKCTKRAAGPHTSGIRSLACVGGDAPIRQDAEQLEGGLARINVASASNDGTVCLWTHNLECVFSLHTCSSSFIYTVAFDVQTQLLAAGDESGSLTVWKLEYDKLLHTCAPVSSQTVQVSPKCVWSVTFVPGGSGEIVCGAADSCLYVFTQDASQALQPETEVHAIQSGRGIGGEQPDRGGAVLPLNQLRLYKGHADGAVSLFGEGGHSIAYQWDENAGNWRNIGRITEPVPVHGNVNVQPSESPAREVSNGRQVDHVAQLEIDSASKGFIQAELGFNDNDDPMKIAQDFCVERGLMKEYVQQIADFISLHQHKT